MVDLLGLMNLVDFSIISAALGVLAGVINSIFASRRAEKQRQTEIETRQTQLHMNILANTRSTEFLKHYIEVAYGQEYKDYEEWREKYGPRTNPEAYVAYVHVTGLYQNLGYLIKRKIMEPEELAEQIRPRSFIFLWEKIIPIVKYHRETLNPKAYDSFELLVNEMRKILDTQKN